MKEEMLEAIYGTVERLEQKVDELSASPKNAGAETVLSPASIDTSKLEKAILSVSAKEEETIGKMAKLREAICIFTDLTKKEASKDELRSKLLFDTINQVKQELNATSKNVQDKLHAMGNTPQKKIVTHRFEPTSKYVLLFIGGLALSLVISIWGNLTQWREHQDWEEADLKYRALRMVLPSDDPNIRYIEKHFSVQRDEEVINNVRNCVAVYEDSVRRHYEMIEIAATCKLPYESLFSSDLNSETSVSYASCENCAKNENYASSDPQENSSPCQWLSAKPKAGSSASQFELFRHYYPIRS